MNAPISEKERIVSIDIIRGFAVFGIFFVNVPTMLGMEGPEGRSYEGIDAIVRLFYDLFIQTKFYTIFSFLFGYGFYIFMMRAEARGAKAGGLFLRRLLVLLLFGLVHYLLLWYGDILHSYALSGFFLLLLYRRKPYPMLLWGILLLAMFAALVGLGNDTAQSLPTTVEPANPLGHWTMKVADRYHYFFSMVLPNDLAYLPEEIGLFLLGLFAAKIKLFQRVGELRRQLGILCGIALLSGMLFSIPIVTSFLQTKPYTPANQFFYVLAGGKMWALFYVTALLLLTRSETWERRLSGLACVGRMALTNYLLQTVITVIMVSLLVKNTAAIPLWSELIYCALIFLGQIWFSRWWLSRFAYGPLEWLWRLGTYGGMQAIRRAKRGE